MADRHSTTKDINNIREWVNQLTEAQSTQQETLVHIAPILNITKYAAQVDRHSINVLMDRMDETSQDVQLDYLIGHQSLLSSTHTIHQVSVRKPLRLAVLH